MKSVFDNYICHGNEHGGIGAGPDGYPFVGEDRRRLRESRINGDYLNSFLLDFGQSEGGIGVPDGYGRVPAPHDDQLGVKQILKRITGSHGAIGCRRCVYGAFIRGGSPGAGVTSEHSQQLLCCSGAVQNCLAATAEEQHNAGIAIGVPDSYQLSRHGIQGFVPGDSLELAIAACAHSLHGVLQSVGGVKFLAISASPEAGTELGLFPGVRFYSDNLAVLNMCLKHASSATIVAATGVDYVCFTHMPSR